MEREKVLELVEEELREYQRLKASQLSFKIGLPSKSIAKIIQNSNNGIYFHNGLYSLEPFEIKERNIDKKIKEVLREARRPLQASTIGEFIGRSGHSVSRNARQQQDIYYQNGLYSLEPFEPDELNYQCPFCSTKVSSFIGLLNHVRSRHFQDGKCLICKKHFKSLGGHLAIKARYCEEHRLLYGLSPRTGTNAVKTLMEARAYAEEQCRL